MSDYFVYKRGGWVLAVDAISAQDAAQYVRIWAPGAEFVGRGLHGVPKTATIGTTDRRQEEISANLRRFDGAIGVGG